MACPVQRLETQENNQSHPSTFGNHDAVEQILLLNVGTPSLHAQRPSKKIKTDINEAQGSLPQCPPTKVKTNAKSFKIISSDDNFILKAWLSSPNHSSYPYPTGEEKETLTEKTGLSSTQLKSWFYKARRDIRNQIEPDALHKQPLIMTCPVQPLETQEYKHNHLSTGENHDAVEQVLSLKVDTTSLQAQRPSKKLKTDTKEAQDSLPQCPPTKVNTNAKRLYKCSNLTDFILKSWLSSPNHSSYPYPTEEDKNFLMEKTGLSSRQLKDRLVRVRRDIRNQMDPNALAKYYRSLPVSAVTILKEWILSPKHFDNPYPTVGERKLLMEKTGLNSKQLTNWLSNARRVERKLKMVTEHQFQTSTQEYQKQQLHERKRTFVSGPAVSANPKNCQPISLPAVIPPIQPAPTIPEHQQHHERITRTAQSETPMNLANEGVTRAVEHTLGHHNVDRIGKERFVPYSIPDQNQQPQPQKQVMNSSVAPGADISSASSSFVVASTTTTTASNTSAVAYPPLQLKRRQQKDTQQTQVIQQETPSTTATVIPDTISSQGCSTVLVVNQSSNVNTSIGKYGPLSKQVAAILNAWILSPEHIMHPFPTEEEKKLLIEKTGLSSQQLKDCFTHASKKLTKLNLVEKQQHQSSTPEQEQQQLREEEKESLSAQSFFFDQKNNQIIDLSKKDRSLSKQAVAILKSWIASPDHSSHPYPTEEEKKVLIEKTGFSSQQLKNWFNKARRDIRSQETNALTIDFQPLPDSIVTILKEWISAPKKFDNPYPTKHEKKLLTEKTGLTPKQLNEWFVRARKKIRKKKAL